MFIRMRDQQRGFICSSEGSLCRGRGAVRRVGQTEDGVGISREGGEHHGRLFFRRRVGGARMSLGCLARLVRCSYVVCR